jgi:hypothetical protein
VSQDEQRRAFATTEIGCIPPPKALKLSVERTNVVDLADGMVAAVPLETGIGPAADAVESGRFDPISAVVAVIPIVPGSVLAVPSIAAAEEAMVALVPPYAAAGK